MSDTHNKLQCGNKYNHWKILDLVLDLNYFSFSNPKLTHVPKHQTLSPNHHFSQRIWYVEYCSVHAHMAWGQKFRLTPGWIVSVKRKHCAARNAYTVGRATIDLEPKIRRLGKFWFCYPKRKKLFLFARPTSDHMLAYLSPGTICFSMSYSRHPSWNRHGKRFFRFVISWIKTFVPKPAFIRILTRVHSLQC